MIKSKWLQFSTDSYTHWDKNDSFLEISHKQCGNFEENASEQS